jgi:ribose transport system substrate-binding protein
MTSAKIYTIGFSNLTEESPFCRIVREGLEAAVAQHRNLRLICRDNALDDEKALANVRHFAEVPVDLGIIFHINERIGSKLAQMLMVKRIPIIAVDVPIPLTTYFGVDNRQAGALVGHALVDWINTHWHGKLDKVLATSETRVLESVRVRTSSTIDVLASLPSFNSENVLYIDSGHNRDLTIEFAMNIIQRWSDFHHIAAVGFSENSTLGMVEAVRRLGRQSDTVIVGQSGTEESFAELRRPDTPLVAVTNYRPQDYGSHLVDLALRIFKGEKPPSLSYIEPSLFTQDTVPSS